MNKSKPNEAVILIIDDNLDNLKLLSDMLEKNGYKTRRAINGNLALQALNATNFDLILLDINMPSMDGYQVCQKIKANPEFDSIPVIFISALNDVLDKVKAFKVGGIDYITKPFQIEEVTARVANQIRIRNLQKELKNLNQKLDKKNEKLQLKQESLKNSQAIIVNNSLKDPITNLNTKIAFMGQIRQVISKSKAHHIYNYILIVIQYEQLKKYQYLLNSEEENRCAALIAKKINKVIGQDSFASRLDDNRFGILIQNIPDLKVAISQLQTIQKSLKIDFKASNYQINLDPNYGIVVGAQEYQKPEKLLYDARIALNESLIEGYGNYKLFKPEHKYKIVRELELQTQFKKALKEQIFGIHYQPILCLSTQKISGLEATIDWEYNRETKITLRQLTQLAREKNLLEDFNQLILQTICDRLRKLQEVLIWHNNLEDDITSNFIIKLKLATAQLLQSNFPQQLNTIITQKNIEKEGILLEFPVEVFITNFELALKNITALQQLKINLSIDRIGTDLITTMCQNNLAIKNLTINSHLLQALEQKDTDIKINHHLIEIAHNLNMSVTATEISNPMQLEIIKQQGYDFATGKYINQLTQDKIKDLDRISS
ncbi:putative Diguanylate cyclase (GGDEF) domain-containing protein [Hyella patelloides LEGE 07179]|uniref:Putative Diguanylate cyclase (GGDEF) domain-containing protein n=1 Tax=Hyella patelloides LEGE 07179 TaxID=945734 RepID=A0A563VR12_9CYAN|nr:EAL domain-containing protein [Hyella patelloides]VEP13902.1 putative Diguanylate cyclase (GGDEF) domain-containing protein [Hyella patelloides LEGE 07179]